MTRRAARITHDEIARMIKGVRAGGLPIARVTMDVSFDRARIDVIIGDSGEKFAPAVDAGAEADPLLREPEL